MGVAAAARCCVSMLMVNCGGVVVYEDLLGYPGREPKQCIKGLSGAEEEHSS